MRLQGMPVGERDLPMRPNGPPLYGIGEDDDAKCHSIVKTVERASFAVGAKFVRRATLVEQNFAIAQMLTESERHVTALKSWAPVREQVIRQRCRRELNRLREHFAVDLSRAEGDLRAQKSRRPNVELQVEFPQGEVGDQERNSTSFSGRVSMTDPVPDAPAGPPAFGPIPFLVPPAFGHPVSSAAGSQLVPFTPGAATAAAAAAASNPRIPFTTGPATATPEGVIRVPG